MTRQVSLSIKAVDNLIDLLKSLTKAATPPELPTLDKRDKTLWRRAKTTAKRELKKAIEKRKSTHVVRPGGYRKSPSDTTQQFNETVRRNAERKYRELDPALAAAGAKKAEAAKGIAAKLSELLRWHRPALLKALSKDESNCQEWDMTCSNAIRPVPDPVIAGYRYVVLQDLRTIRLKLEERRDGKVDVIKDLANKEKAHVTPPGGGKGNGKRISKKEANLCARKILEKTLDIKARDLATKIGCSLSLVYELPAWQTVQEGRKKKRKPKTPKVVSFPKGTIEQTTEPDPAEFTDSDSDLQKLTEEQQVDGKSDGSINPYQPRRKPKFNPRREP